MIHGPDSSFLPLCLDNKSAISGSIRIETLFLGGVCLFQDVLHAFTIRLLLVGVASMTVFVNPIVKVDRVVVLAVKLSRLYSMFFFYCPFCLNARNDLLLICREKNLVYSLKNLFTHRSLRCRVELFLDWVFAIFSPF